MTWNSCKFLLQISFGSIFDILLILLFEYSDQLLRKIEVAPRTHVAYSKTTAAHRTEILLKHIFGIISVNRDRQS